MPDDELQAVPEELGLKHVVLDFVVYRFDLIKECELYLLPDSLSLMGEIDGINILSLDLHFARVL